MDVFLIFFAVGVCGGAAFVTLLWIIWWEREKSRPIHCPKCDEAID